MGSAPAFANSRTFRSLRHPNYFRWFIGQTISMLGYFVQVTALTVLVLDISDSGTVLGIVTALNFLPIIVLGPWGGVLSDRVDKRRLLIVTQATLMMCAIALGAVVVLGMVTLELIILIATAGGCAFAIDQPARRTIVAELVPASEAGNAISLNGALTHVAKVGGPALAGLLISTVGTGWCFLLNGATSIAVLIALIGMDPLTMHPTEALAPRRGQIVEGLRYVATDRPTRRTLTVVGVLGLFAMSWNVIVPLLVLDELDRSTTVYAAVMGWMSVGSVAGLLWLARQPEPAESTLTVSVLVMGIGLAALAVAPNALATAPSVFVVGAAGMIVVNGTVVTLQLTASPTMRGRVIASFSIVLLGTYAFGNVIAGWIAERFGTRASIALGGVVSIATATALAASGERRRVADTGLSTIVGGPTASRPLCVRLHDTLGPGNRARTGDRGSTTDVGHQSPLSARRRGNVEGGVDPIEPG